MKADLTLPQNQAAFKLQYYGLNCYKTHASSTSTHQLVDDFYISEILKGYGVLSLRHISSLTKEEKMKLLKSAGWAMREFLTMGDMNTVKSLCDGIIDNTRATKDWNEFYNPQEILNAVDYLRSISILIPWRGNSCDDLIASGVAVYREERKEGA